MYLHYRIENPYLDSFSIGAHTLHSILLFTDSYTMYFPVFTPLHLWLALPVIPSNLTSLVNLYFFQSAKQISLARETFSGPYQHI